MTLSPLRLQTLVFLAFLGAYLLVSLFATERFLAASLFGDHDGRATLPAMISGTAYRPFVYRQLAPKIIGAIAGITPMGVRDSINSALSGEMFFTLVQFDPRLHNAVLQESSDTMYVRVVMTIVIYLFLCGYMLALYRLGQFFFPNDRAVALFAPLVGPLMAAVFPYPALTTYDFPDLCLSAMCYLAMARQQWRQYFIWFALACVNKETAVFIIIFYAIYYYNRLDRKSFFTYGAVQLAIWANIKMAISFVYRHNPGVVLENHFLYHLTIFFTDFTVYALLGIFTIVFLLIYDWRNKPLFVRTILWMLPIMYPFYFIYGFPKEYRVFFDFFPLLTLLVTDTLVRCTGISREAVFNPPDPRDS